MPIQIRLTVLGSPGSQASRGLADHGVDVLVTAPADTPLAAVIGPLASAATPGSTGLGPVFCEDVRLDPQRTLLGHPPLVDGAVLALKHPMEPLGPMDAPARLLVVSGPDSGGVHLLHGGDIRIGRSAEADVPLNDPDVSRLHCTVTLDEDGTVTVTDLGSTNGTAVDGRPVTDGPVPLPPGAPLRLGESTLRVLPQGHSAEPVAQLRPGAGSAAAAAGAAERPGGRRGLAAWASRRRGASIPGPTSATGPRSVPAAPAEMPWADQATVLLTALESGSSLWERRAAGPETFQIRLGTAQRASGPLLPVTVDLSSVGSFGLAGPRDRLAGLARAMLSQLAAAHPPSRLELVVLARDRAADWSWLGWLPHLRPSRGQDCRLLMAFDHEQARTRLNELTERLSDAAGDQRTVVLVDGDPGDEDLRDAAARLAADGPAAGIHLLCLVETPAATPASPLAVTLDVARQSSPAFAACGSAALLSGAVATTVRLVGPDGEPGAVATVDAVSPAWAERFARALAPLREAHVTGGAPPAPATALPETCRLLDVLELPRVTPAALRDRWLGPPGLPLVLGAGTEGPVVAELPDTAGPVLVAGGARSGKTELLCALAASLAVTRSPTELSLLLVEGLGEGLAPCAELPHVASYLGATDPVRMRAFAQALREELKRRAALLGNRDFRGGPRGRGPDPGGGPVADNRVAGPRTASGAIVGGAPAMRTADSGPLPRLVVFVDDFDALLAPALGAPGRQAAGSVVRALEAVALDGRRLGVHLIAAAPPLRRPAGMRIFLTGQAPGRAELRRPDGTETTFQAGRVTGRIPRTSTLRPTVVPEDWARAGDPPAKRPVRELGNGPTDVALLASAAARAARTDRAAAASLV